MKEFQSNHTKTHFCFFSDLNPAEIEYLQLNDIKSRINKDEVLYNEGDAARYLYVLLSGTIKIHMFKEDGKEYISKLVTAGDLLGYTDIINNTPYKFNAIALEDTILFKISKEKFLNLLQNNTEFSNKILKLLAQELNESENYRIILSEIRARERVTYALNFFINKYGIDKNNAIKIKISRKNISELLSMTPESVVRVLANLKKEGIIDFDGKKIIINKKI